MRTRGNTERKRKKKQVRICTREDARARRQWVMEEKRREVKVRIDRVGTQRAGGENATEGGQREEGRERLRAGEKSRGRATEETRDCLQKLKAAFLFTEENLSFS